MKVLSCAELSNRIEKSIALTTKVLNEMMAEGIIVSEGHAPSSGGRRPITYSLKNESFYIIAVAMDQFVTRIAVMDPQLNIINNIAKRELNLAENANALNELASCIESEIVLAGIDRNKIIGIGIGMPGFINAKQGSNYTFMGEHIATHIQSQVKIPVFIDNDSSLIGLAENKFGEAKNEKNALIINLSWGIGLGMIIDSKLFRGDEGFAGELSHIPLFSNGKLCSCGKTGCLETETSLNYMLAEAENSIKNGRPSVLKDLLANAKDHEEKYEAFIKAAKIGDSLVIEIVSKVSYNIGRGVAILIHLLNPGKIIISGRCSAAGKVWLAPIHQALYEFCIPKLVKNITIELSKMSHTAEIMGAAALVIENIHSCTIEAIHPKQYQLN
ncbi:MAG: ROK family protein [Arachidicoccus sp.]|nr:ROK family protein [Arachidicoccus sp.]